MDNPEALAARAGARCSPAAAPPPRTTPARTRSAEPAGGAAARRGTLRKRLGGALAAIVALVAKFFAAIKGVLLLLPKLKLLTTAGTALVSVAAYSLFFGWTFAVGFVVLLFVHEMGHVIQLRREGIKASAPMFIPFLGAVVTAKSLGENALAEARVGLAGPVLGTAGAAACLAIAEATNSDFFRALAYIGFFLNLFNLLPVVPLDGGRAMAAMAPWMWFVGLGALVALAARHPQPDPADHRAARRHRDVAALEAAQERARSSRPPTTASSPRNRLLVGAVYIGLIVLLAFGMDEAHILSSAGHSFRSL